MSKHTYLAFDFGTKHIGLAVGNDLSCHGTPLTVTHSQRNVPDWPQIDRIIAQWQPVGLVVGLPKQEDGTMQPIAKRAQHFAKQLRQRTSLPVFFQDETLSTYSAKQQARDAQWVDAEAAAIILTDFLSTKNSKTSL